MEDTTRIFGQVQKLVERLAPTMVCGPCVAERVVDEVQAALGELAGRRDFVRANDACGLCGEERRVIGKRA